MQILVCFFGLAELSVQILFSCGRCECLKRHGESELGADFRVYCVAKTSRGLESFPAGGGGKQINKVSPTKTSHNIPCLFCCLNDYVRLAYVY
jgi:hypothetical protein